jgi:hypothetical protein
MIANDITIAVVVTTIGDGTFAEQLRPLFIALEQRLSLIVVGDHRTPPECAANLARLSDDGHDICWMDVQTQTDWLSQVPGLARHIPWNSDNRRNIGILEAWRRKRDVIVLMDDDNAPVDHADFVSRYGKVGTTVSLRELITGERWVNVCELLECRSRYDDRPVHIYPRGFPLSRRGGCKSSISPAATSATVAMHLGLWLDEPDVDAATRGAVAPVSVRATTDQPLFLPAGALSAFSSQNVAVARRVVPAWWFARMGTLSSGLRIDRFGDMIQGYFAAIAIAAMGERIAVGPPLVRHQRNAHSVIADMAVELLGMDLLEAMLPLLEAPAPKAVEYPDLYLALAHRLTDWAREARAPLWRDHLPAWADATAETMQAWVHACKALDAQRS